MTKPRAVLLLVLPIALGAQVNVENVLDQVRSEVKPEQAMDYMRHVYSTDRWFTFPKFQQTAEYLKQAMTDAGLQKVELLGAPADGITAEIVEWNEKSDVRGKLVLTRQNPANIKWDLVKKGVLGAINTFTENPELQDGRQWINAWGDNGWAFTKGSAPLICFSLTPRQAAFVRKLLAEGRTVRAHALVDTRYYAGVYPYVTGVIPGTGSEEEVLTLGHSSEQGAQDNATGVAAMLESLATLNRLIAEQKLPRPKRTIRVL